MADRYPLVVASGTVQEVADGDNINLSGNGIVNAKAIQVSVGAAASNVVHVSSGTSSFIVSGIGSVGIGTTYAESQLNLVGESIGFPTTIAAGTACFNASKQNLRVEGRTVLGISTDLAPETGIGGCRAGALTVSYDAPAAYNFGADPGDVRRNTSFISLGNTSPVIVCMRNVTTGTFFDWVAEPVTNRLYLYADDVRSAPALSVAMDNKVGFGTTAVTGDTKYYFDGEIRYTDRPSAASVTALGVDSSGIVRESSSSRRFKENIVPYEKGLADIDNLNPVTFNYTGDETTIAGLIAEDVHDAGLTEFVTYEEDNETPKAINYGHMIALMANAIKELKAEVAALKAAQ